MCAFWSRDDESKRKRQALLDLLADIRDQRAKLKLEFEDGATSLADVSGSLVDFDEHGLTVELASLKGATRAFDGQSLSCFFRVRESKAPGREQFLCFDSRVLSGKQLVSGVTYFALAFPENLRSAQLRRSVRVKVDGRLVPEFCLWPEFENRQSAPSRDHLLGPEHLAEGKFRVEDFSANGFRLRVENGLLHTLLPQPAKGARYAVSFSAVATPGEAPVPFWASAVLRHALRDQDSGETSLSFEFVAEAELDEFERIIWKPLRYDELSGLGRFVLKWNLDQYRAKGIGDL